MTLPKSSARRFVARSTAAALVLVAAAVLPAVAGCGSNALPQIAVPTADEQAAPPRWYPEAPWSASGGQSRIFIEGKVVFDTDRAVIRPGSEKVLTTLLKFASEHPEVTLLRVEGHTDDRAS